MTRKTRALLPTTPLSVTVPHTLDLDEQVRQDGLSRCCSFVICEAG